MAETSRGRVTITLGGSGQVVKRAAAVFSDNDFVGSLPAGGNKRSVRDRIGSSSNHSDGSLSFASQVSNSKRQRGESYATSLSSGIVEDVRIDKNDLRFKLMEKTVFRRAPSDDNQKTMDLREKLSRTAPPPAPPYSHPDSWQHLPERNDASVLGQSPPTRSAEDLPMMNLSRSSYSPMTLEHIRRRSPSGVTGSSRGMSPPRNVGELHRMPLKRAYGDLGKISYVKRDIVKASRSMDRDIVQAPRPMSRDIVEAPRSMNSSTSFTTNSALPTISLKHAAPLMAQFTVPSGIVQKSSYTGDEQQQTVEGLLNSLGLEKYAVIFKAEEVDMTALKQMRESDLKELGIPMGPRKKILLALLPHSKRQP